MDMRLEEFELPALGKDEVLIKVVTDSLCASTYKAVKQGTAHKRVPNDIAEKPIIIGHELCGEIVEVGEAIKDKWNVGQRIVIQPALKLESGGMDNAAEVLREMSDGGFDDVFVMVPVPALFTMAEEICREDGCVNFFAGPAVHNMQGSINLYRIHYDGIHVVGTAGSIPEDTVDTIHLIEEGKVNTGALVSHILGLGAVADTILAMEKPGGAKKVCYTGIDIPLVAIDDLEELGKDNELYRELAKIVKANGGLWCTEAEQYLLENGPKA